MASFRPVDARYRLEAYATISGARPRWLHNWTPLQRSSPKAVLCEGNFKVIGDPALI